MYKDCFDIFVRIWRRTFKNSVKRTKFHLVRFGLTITLVSALFVISRPTQMNQSTSNT